MLNVGRQVRESGGFTPRRSLSESEIVIVQRDNFALLGRVFACINRIKSPPRILCTNTFNFKPLHYQTTRNCSSMSVLNIEFRFAMNVIIFL